MAGIGFELRKLSGHDSIFQTLASFGHAAVVAAGPWLFTILSLAAITVLTEPIAGLAQLATFRVTVIYAFAVSLVAAAPVTIVATRLAANALWQKRAQDIPTLLIGALVLAALLAGGAALLLALSLQPPIQVAMALVACSVIVALIWVALCFAGTIRDYVGVTMSFILGLLCSVCAAIVAVLYGQQATSMVWGFNLGLAITFFSMAWRVIATFPHAVGSPLAAVGIILAGIRSYWQLAAGALLGTAGVWADKWIFWLSENGETTETGLLHAPLYDSAMFIASLVLIPSLAAFVVRLETDFFDRYQQYYATISSHGTLGQIEAARSRLARFTIENFTFITIAQVGYCAILVLTAPLIVEALNLQFRQTSILRFGGLGAVFHFIFIACSSMVLFFDRRVIYMLLQGLFLLANAGLTLYSLQAGEDYYGVGYFLACVLCGFVAYRAADVTFQRLNFLTFIGNNPSVTEAARRKVRRWPGR